MTQSTTPTLVDPPLSREPTHSLDSSPVSGKTELPSTTEPDSFSKTPPPQRMGGPSPAEEHSYEGQGTLENPYVVKWDPVDRRNPLTWTSRKKWTIVSINAIGTLCQLVFLWLGGMEWERELILLWVLRRRVRKFGVRWRPVRDAGLLQGDDGSVDAGTISLCTRICCGVSFDAGLELVWEGWKLTCARCRPLFWAPFR